MAEASRFPHLSLPFAIVGAAGGWLSAGLAGSPLFLRSHPISQGVAAVVAAGFAALTGLLLTRWCMSNGDHHAFAENDPDVRAPSDTAARQTLAVLVGGAATGAVASLACGAHFGPGIGALGGLICALAFVPVCLVVIAAARRAQRARLGSLVAGSDRRAVWGILATALSVTTLEALPDWPASAVGQVRVPVPATLMLAAAALVITAALIADIVGLRRAGRAFVPGLVERDPARLVSTDLAAPRLDLGLGEEIRARVTATAAAYRGSDRTLALVQGDREQATSALRRGLRRGVFGLTVVALCGMAHAAAAGESGRRLFDEQRCEHLDSVACGRVADAIRRESPWRAMRLYEQACSVASVASCVAAAEMHAAEADSKIKYPGRALNTEPNERVEARNFWGRACRYGDRQGCLRAMD